MRRGKDFGPCPKRLDFQRREDARSGRRRRRQTDIGDGIGLGSLDRAQPLEEPIKRAKPVAPRRWPCFVQAGETRDSRLFKISGFRVDRVHLGETAQDVSLGVGARLGAAAHAVEAVSPDALRERRVAQHAEVKREA